MSWKCKKCGGRIYAIVTSSQSKTFTLGKSGMPERCLRKYNEETIGINYFCNECDSFWEKGTKLEDIAEWKDD